MVASLPQTMPSAFVCPISGAIAQDPVLASDGWSYAKDALLHLQQSQRRPKSPITGEPLDAHANVDNQALRRAVQDFLGAQRTSQDTEAALRRHTTCPLSGEIMELPVALSDGHAYELGRVPQFLAELHVSPFTNQPLQREEWLRPDRALQQLCQHTRGPGATKAYPEDAMWMVRCAKPVKRATPTPALLPQDAVAVMRVQWQIRRHGLNLHDVRPMSPSMLQYMMRRCHNEIHALIPGLRKAAGEVLDSESYLRGLLLPTARAMIFNNSGYRSTYANRLSAGLDYYRNFEHLACAMDAIETIGRLKGLNDNDAFVCGTDPELQQFRADVQRFWQPRAHLARAFKMVMVTTVGIWVGISACSFAYKSNNPWTALFVTSGAYLGQPMVVWAVTASRLIDTPLPRRFENWVRPKNMWEAWARMPGLVPVARHLPNAASCGLLGCAISLMVGGPAFDLQDEQAKMARISHARNAGILVGLGAYTYAQVRRWWCRAA